jgi:hypothetical protein
VTAAEVRSEAGTDPVPVWSAPAASGATLGLPAATLAAALTAAAPALAAPAEAEALATAAAGRTGALPAATRSLFCLRTRLRAHVCVLCVTHIVSLDGCSFHRDIS